MKSVLVRDGKDMHGLEVVEVVVVAVVAERSFRRCELFTARVQRPVRMQARSFIFCGFATAADPENFGDVAR